MAKKKASKRAKKVKADRYELGVAERKAIQAELEERMADWDYVIGPTAPTAPELIGEENPTRLQSRNTLWFNLSRQPAVSIPNGLTRDGMPTSIMFAARRFEDRSLLEGAQIYQTATDHHLRYPSICAQ